MRRIVRNALWMLLALALVGGLWKGWGTALSVLIGGAAAWVNFHWMAAAVDRLLSSGGRPDGALTIGKYLLRLLLIFGTLFAMIHFPFLSLLGGAAGLSIFVLAGMWEAVLLLWKEFSPDR